MANRIKRKLDAGQKHMLGLVARGADAEGWAPVSSMIFPLLDRLPLELVEREVVGDDGRGRARLTVEGQHLVAAMEWL